MASYSATTTIKAGSESFVALKSGAYNEVIKLTQIVDNTSGFLTIASGSTTKGVNTLSDCKSMIIRNNSLSGAEIQIVSWAIVNATPDTVGALAYDVFLLGAGDYIYLPNWRLFKINGDASGGDAYTLDNQAPHGNMYVALDNAAAGDAQLLNGTELASGTTATTVTVDEGSYFYEGDLIRLEDEISEVVSVATNVLTIIRGTHGSTAATHADDVAIRMPFFNAYHNFTDATGGYDTAQTDTNGKFKCMNFFGYARNTDGSNGRQSMGLVAGSISGKFYKSGYQGLGLSGITASTNSGLTASETLKLDITANDNTLFQDLTFTLDSSNVNFGGTNGVIAKIQAALDTQYYTAGNLFQTKVTVGIENGDVVFRSGSHLSTSAILLADTGDSDTFIDAAANGRIPPAAKLADPVAAALPPDTIIDKKTGVSSPNAGEMFYDDGFGNIKGVCNGTINYETGALDITGCPPNAHFVVSANYGSGHSGGNRFTTDDANSISSINARSTNSKLNATIEIIGLN